MDFSRRHIGPNNNDIDKMLSYLGFDSIEALISATIPDDIQFNEDNSSLKPKSEYGLSKLDNEIFATSYSAKNKINEMDENIYTKMFVILRNKINKANENGLDSLLKR